MKRMLSLAGLLLVAAVALAVVGLVLRAVRWLLVVAALVLVLGAVLGAKARSARED